MSKAESTHPHSRNKAYSAGCILIPPPPDAARRKGTQRLRCSMGRCSRRGSLKAAFRRWYQDAPYSAQGLIFGLPCLEARIQSRPMRVLILGCGYVGLPLGAELAKQ